MPAVYDALGRNFNSKDKQAVLKYLDAFHSHLQANNVIQRIQHLMQSGQSDHAVAEIIDRELTRACEHAGNSCKKRRLDYWSIDLHLLKCELSIWCQFRSRQHRKLSSIALILRATEFNIDLDPTLDNVTLNAKITELKSSVKDIHQQAATKRETCQLEQANMAEDASDNDRAKAIRQIKNNERKNRAFQSLKFQRKKHNQAMTLTRLEVPVPLRWWLHSS